MLSFCFKQVGEDPSVELAIDLAAERQRWAIYRLLRRRMKQRIRREISDLSQGGAAVAHQTHTLEVAGSTPAPATNVERLARAGADTAAGIATGPPCPAGKRHGGQAGETATNLSEVSGPAEPGAQLAFFTGNCPGEEGLPRRADFCQLQRGAAALGSTGDNLAAVHGRAVLPADVQGGREANHAAMSQAARNYEFLWWCAHCHSPAELADAGEVFPMCLKCGSRNVQWIEREDRVAPIKVAPALELVPDSAKSPGKRLPSSKRNLRILAETGYLVCRGCEQITEERNGCCVLCGHADLERVPPVFPKEESHE